MYKDLPERFHSKVMINEETGCHEWTGSIRPNGYPQYWHDGRNDSAHRVACAAEHGIPDGLVVDHLCRVRHCVNPDHLEAVTQRVNVQRGEKGMKGMKTGARQRAKTHCPRGHKYDDWNTMLGRNRSGGISRSCRQCKEDRRSGQRARGERVT